MIDVGRKDCRLWLLRTCYVLICGLFSACAIEAEGLESGVSDVWSVTFGATEVPVPTPFYYEVSTGESLWTIAERFGLDVELLTVINELDHPDLIQPGQQLLISDRITVSGKVIPTRTPTPFPCIDGCRQQAAGCEIKAVIARMDGKRMFLLPKDSFYNQVSADYWFCRIQDATAAGWERWQENGRP